jgi:hypothetical protein
MASETTNLHLIKPDPEEAVDIAPINANSDTLDAVYAAMNASISAKASQSDMTVAEERISGLESGLAATANAGAKNLICNTASSRTEAGVTFTVEPDGSVSLNGTAANTIWFPIMTNMSIAAGTYTISNGLADDTARVIISPTNAVNQRIFDSNENGYITRTIEAVSGVNAYLRIASGKITDGVTVKPMLRDAAISDGTYQPYAPTNRELYQMILALRSGSSVQSLTPSAQLTATEPTEEDR